MGLRVSTQSAGPWLSSLAGGQANQINFLLDGGDNNTPSYNTNLPFPFPDALQEFSVQTTGLGAQYGLHPSATVNIVTKSGTNQVHGGAFEFIRNNYTNASNRISSVVTPLKRNQYGGYLGGPVVHDKLFLFGGYQGTALRISQAATAVVPTAASVNGNWTPYFAATRAAGGLCQFATNGKSGTPVGNGTDTTNSTYLKLKNAGFTLDPSAACTATISPTLYSPDGAQGRRTSAYCGDIGRCGRTWRITRLIRRARTSLSGAWIRPSRRVKPPLRVIL